MVSLFLFIYFFVLFFRTNMKILSLLEPYGTKTGTTKVVTEEISGESIFALYLGQLLSPPWLL